LDTEIDNDDDDEEVIDDSTAKIESKVDWLLPEIRKHESTMDSFNRLTLQRPWIPFNSGKTAMNDLDREEATLFESMKGNYRRNVSPRAR
jgi:hypothetical protein